MKQLGTSTVAGSPAEDAGRSQRGRESVDLCWSRGEGSGLICPTSLGIFAAGLLPSKRGTDRSSETLFRAQEPSTLLVEDEASQGCVCRLPGRGPRKFRKACVRSN